MPQIKVYHNPHFLEYRGRHSDIAPPVRPVATVQMPAEVSAKQALEIAFRQTQPVAHSPGELHIALGRMWQSLWANVEDEISRARGNGGTGGFFGLPPIKVEDLTITSAARAVYQENGQMMAANGSR